MKIGIDARCLIGGRQTGVEEYTLSLLRNLLRLDKKNEYVLFLNSFSDPKINSEEFKEYRNLKIRRFRFPNKILNFLFWYLRWPKVDKMLGGLDIFFMPNINFGAFSKEVKLIITAHDLSFEYYPETFSLKRRLWHAFVNPKKLYRRADKIISVSESTGDDLMALYGIGQEKIETIHSGVNNNFGEIDRNDPKLLEIKNKYKLPYKYILYLGTIEPRKNIVGIIRAYNRLRKNNHVALSDYKLVIAGAKGWKYEKIFQEIVSSSYRKDIMLTGFICENDKPYVYNLATLFIYPSFFEGFGFPPLEAMRCGVPVIVANNSSFPETVGNGGLLIDPDKPDEIYQTMLEILNHKSLQSKFKTAGISQATKFDWRKTAQEFAGVIEGL